jgi:hypothetical protein
MRSRSRLVSVALSHLAVMVGLCALPTSGQSAALNVVNWFQPGGFPSGTDPTTLISTHTIPMWSGTDGGSTFVMVGADPSVPKTGNTRVDAKIIPIRFSSASPALIFDPENNSPCLPIPALNMVQQSPLFRDITLPGNQSAIGTGQFASLFQRGNFSSLTVNGASPDYKVVIARSLDNRQDKGKKTIPIESLGGSVMTTGANPDWCTSVAMIDVNQWETYLQGTIIPDLRKSSGPKTVLIFLFANVVLFDSTAGCCILSYHSAFPSALTGAESGQMQSYIVANFDATNGSIKGTPFSGAFPTSPDIAGLANAVAGWMDNPTTLNNTMPVPNWPGTINGTTGCQNVLEVSFPDGLTGTAAPQLNAITIHGRVYHVNDLAFKSWFYRDTGIDNTGFGGAYSLFGSFSTPAATCP